MKKFFMLAAVVALVAAALALPAMAQVNFDDCFPFCNNDRSANQSVDQDAQGSDRARFDNNNNDDENDFFDFFGDRFDNSNNNDAAVSQSFDQQAQSGDVNIQSSVTSSGDYAQQCVAPLQFGNTGNLQNAQGFLQYGSTADDVGLGGSSFNFSPSVSTECNQAVQQSAAASSR